MGIRKPRSTIRLSRILVSLMSRSIQGDALHQDSKYRRLISDMSACCASEHASWLCYYQSVKTFRSETPSLRGVSNGVDFRICRRQRSNHQDLPTSLQQSTSGLQSLHMISSGTLRRSPGPAVVWLCFAVRLHRHLRSFRAQLLEHLLPVFEQSRNIRLHGAWVRRFVLL